MGETGKDSGNGETGGVVVVNVENSKKQVNSETQSEAKKKAGRVDKMDQFHKRLKTAKIKVTKSLNKIEPVIKYEQERDSASEET